VSGFTEARTLPGAESVPSREIGALTTVPRRSDNPGEMEQVIFWRKRCERREGAEDFKEYLTYRDEARKIYKGDLLDSSDIKSWKSASGDGIVVQVNLLRRILCFYLDAIFSSNPNINVRPRAGRSNEQTLANASSVEAVLKYLWEETKQSEETLRTLKDAWLSGMAASQLVHDPHRDLWKMQWLACALIVDPECHGDIRRARWYAFKYKRPAVSILRDTAYPEDKRARLYEQWSAAFSKSPEGVDVTKTVYEVHSREGIDPLAAIRSLGGEAEAAPAEGEGESEQVVKFVIAEGFNEFLLTVPKPCPYLDDDEANVAVLCLDEMPGEWFAPPVWKMLKGLVEAINWLVSFHTTAMKKRALTVVLTNDAIWKGGDAKLSGSSCFQAHPVNGDPKQAASVLSLADSQMVDLAAAEQLLKWLERISGFNEVARGESGGRKTATEADNLQRNTSLVTKGANRQFDGFLKESLRLMGLAALYYMPAFSRTVGPDGQVMTQQAVQMPMMPPPGMEQQAPPEQQVGMPGQPPQQQMQTVMQPIPVDPEEAQQLGAVPFPDGILRMPDTQVTETEPSFDEMGSLIPGVPQFVHPSPGKMLRRGVDYYCGQEVATGWPIQAGYNLDDVKRDLLLTFEAGSTRADYRHDQQQTATNAIQLLGGIYQQTGSWDQVYELLVIYTQSLGLDDAERLVPPRQQFVMGMQQSMMAAQQQQQAEGERKDREVGAKEQKAAGGPPA
jgi:hypothetical protein